MVQPLAIGRPQPKFLLPLYDPLNIFIFITMLLNIVVSCLAIARVPSGLLSSIMTTSTGILLYDE